MSDELAKTSSRFMKESIRQYTGHRRKRLTNFAKIDGISFRFPASLKNLPDSLGLLTKNGRHNITEKLWVGECPGSEMFLSIPDFGSCLQCTSCLLK